MMMEYDKMKDNRWRIKAPELVIILLYLELVRNLISLPALEDEPPLNVATTASVTDENICVCIMSTICIFRGTCPIWGDLLVKMKTIKQLFASSCDRLDFVLYDLDPYPYSHTAITADVEEKRWPIKLIIYPVVVTAAVTISAVAVQRRSRQCSWAQPGAGV